MINYNYYIIWFQYFILSIKGSPTKRFSWKGLFSTYRERDPEWRSSYRNHMPDYRYSQRYTSRYGYPYEYSRYHSPDRLSWKNLNNSYRTYLRNPKFYNSDVIYDPYYNRDYRYSILDSFVKRRPASTTKRISLNRRKYDRIEDDDSLEREEVDTLNRRSRTNFRTLSQSLLNYSRSDSRKRLSARNPWRYSLYDGIRNRLSASPSRRIVTHSGYSPAKKALRDKYDVAQELVEEKKIEPKEDRNSSAKKTAKTFHTLGSSEEDLFVESLRELVALDKDLERAKQSLALKTDFTLHDAFKVFDGRDRDQADINDIIEAFNLFRIFPTVEEARLFLSRYDINKNNKLTFDEFCDAFMPLHQGTADILKSRSEEFPNGYYRRRDEFNSTTIDAFTRVLQLHLEVEVHAEALRQRHEESPYFRYDSAFSTLNKWGDDYLTGKDFKEMFEKYGFYATNEEIDIIVDRFDKDKDGKISYDEFFDEFSPHSPVKV